MAPVSILGAQGGWEKEVEAKLAERCKQNA